MGRSAKTSCSKTGEPGGCRNTRQPAAESSPDRAVSQVDVNFDQRCLLTAKASVRPVSAGPQAPKFQHRENHLVAGTTMIARDEMSSDAKEITGLEKRVEAMEKWSTVTPPVLPIMVFAGLVECLTWTLI